MRLLSPIAALAMFATTMALAGEAHFGKTAFSLENSAKEQSVFTTDAPKIVLHVQVLDMPKGTKLEAAWIAVKTEVAPPNYKIDAAGLELDADIAADERVFWLSKPNAGWPVGDYRVDLSINGKVTMSALFKVEKNGG